jgi:asparaginyl-tRNA synthetase
LFISPFFSEQDFSSSMAAAAAGHGAADADEFLKKLITNAGEVYEAMLKAKRAAAQKEQWLIITNSLATLSDEDKKKLPTTKSGMKKLQNKIARGLLKKKAEEQRKRVEEEKQRRHRASIEHAKQLKIVKPEGIASAVRTTCGHLAYAYMEGSQELQTEYNKHGLLSKIVGWADSIRRHGQKMMFINLRDASWLGTQLQVLLEGPLCQTYEALTLQPESCIAVWGKIRRVAPGIRESRIRSGCEAVCLTDYEFVATYWELIGGAPSGGIEWHRCHNKRNMLRLHSTAVQLIHEYMKDTFVTHVHAPFLFTNSSQPYLESLLSGVGAVYCMQNCFPNFHKRLPSFSTYLQLEVEYPHITLDFLLTEMENITIEVTNSVDMLIETGHMVWDGKPPAPKKLEKGFKRVLYTDLLAWLNDRGMLFEDAGTEVKRPYAFGDDILEKHKRGFVDTIGKPVFICKFPASLNLLYVERDPVDPLLTQSAVLLVPNVGEAMSGSMRMWKLEEVKAALETYSHHLEEQRHVVNCPHGGFVMGIEHMLAYALDLDSVE